MTLLRIFIPGRFEDAQLYMGHLIVFTLERDAAVVELAPLTSRLETAHDEWKGVLTLAFARNDWLTGGPVSSLTRNPQLAGALNDALARLADHQLVLDEDEVNYDRLRDFEPRSDIILDSVLYGSRLYLGTTEGLFDWDIDWDAKRVMRSRRRSDARCVRASAEYGTVNASCEGDGLFTGYDEFGWRQASASGSSLEQTASRSIRTAFLGSDLVNYESPAKLELLRASVDQVKPDDSSRERKVVTGFDDPSAELDRLVEQLTGEEEVPVGGVQFLWNSSRAFFVNTLEHGFFTAVPSAQDRGFKLTRHGHVDGRVVAVHPCAAGWVIETDFKVYLFSAGDVVELLDQEPLSVRTFEGSKRYRRLVAVTVEDGLHLISAVDAF
jgi:hypothetical protein